MYAAIRAIDECLPSRTLTNEDLAREFPNWDPAKIEAKTGIRSRRLAGETELASDLAVEAARKLFRRGVCDAADVDFLILCTQSPDYLLPTTACMVQERLGLGQGVGALDVNLGCSGFIYGLSLAKGLIETSQARRVLLLTCDTYSKYMDAGDFSVRALFGDGASATLVLAEPLPPEGHLPWIGPFVFGTDGRGFENFILRRHGLREPAVATSPSQPAPGARPRDPLALYMDGPEIFSFTLRVVPDSVRQLLSVAQIDMNRVDRFVFHQANRFMLEHLRVKLGIPEEKFVYELRDCGNTTSSSIPIALHLALLDGRVPPGSLAMLVGFGVGYSWGAAMVRCPDAEGTAPARPG